MCRDRASGLVAVVAIHDRALPARGGTRLRPYADLDAAIADAQRLARAMDRKFAVHGLPFSGGKAALQSDDGWADAETRAARLRAYGGFLDALGGAFGTGPDYGFGAPEVAALRAVTQHVVPVESLEPASRATASGVRVALELALQGDLDGSRIAIQGVGAVGAALARQLAERGAALVLADRDAGRVAALAAELGAQIVRPDEVLFVDVDALAPCALGEVLTAEAISRLQCRVVAGAANNQLTDPEAERAAELAARGIVFVPDFVASGGAAVVLTGCSATAEPLSAADAEVRLRAAVAAVLDRAATDRTHPLTAALRIVDERRAARVERKSPTT